MEKSILFPFPVHTQLLILFRKSYIPCALVAGFRSIRISYQLQISLDA